MFDTDHSVVYAGVMPAAPPPAISTFARNTKPIVRVNTTLGLGVARVGREALSFSKKLAHPLDAMQRCIAYNTLTSTAVESEHAMESTTLP
jgi:hypothetical protein